MRIHILGIAGTFMSGLAILAKQCGHEVSGTDDHIYPPMSTQLQEQNIPILEGYDQPIPQGVDCVLVGNVIKRGNPAIEYVMANRMPYTSGPEWLAKNILQGRHVLAVAGTHGKTTTSSLLMWILKSNGYNPGFLIGGIPENIGVSASMSESPYFVIEADEYDSAFFDKRSKFIHYHPQTLILNNLEFDHADIFKSLADIQTQFHYLLRTVPNNGLIIHNQSDVHLQDTLAMGVYSPTTSFNGEGAVWRANLLKADGSAFSISRLGETLAQVNWQLLGEHNVSNALAAIAAAYHVGIPVTGGVAALTTFKNVKRRLEVKANINNIVLYDDFAHHPTAIARTLAGLRAHIGKNARIIVLLEFASFTMRSGLHQANIQDALTTADIVVCRTPAEDWGVAQCLSQFKQTTFHHVQIDELVKFLQRTIQPGDHIVMMSNSEFGGLGQKIINSMRGITLQQMA